MDFAVSAADAASVSADLGCAVGSSKANAEECYLVELLRASLKLVRKRLPLIIQHHGFSMLKHLQSFRKAELSRNGCSDVRNSHVEFLDNLVLKEPRSNLRSLAAVETKTVIGEVTGGVLRGLSLESNNSISSDRSCDGSSCLSNEMYCSSSSEDYDYIQFLNDQGHFGGMDDVINACKVFVEFAEPGMPVNGEISSHGGNGCLLLAEHNIICQAFLIVISHSGAHEYNEILNCLLIPLNKIWTLQEWKSKYLHHGSGLTRLLSNSQFLRMAYCMVRICEEKLKMSRTEGSIAMTSCEFYTETLLQLFLPFLLQLLQCIHGLWDATIACNLSEDLERAKYPEPSFPFECSTKLLYIRSQKGSRVEETRAVLEGIRESGYNVIGLCSSVEGVFSKLLNGLSDNVALTKYFGSLEFRHLIKFIQLTIIPLVKNCPCKFWTECADKFLQPLLRHCEQILHSTWFSLLYHGRPGVPYYFGKLSGLEGKLETLKRDILLEFTRVVSGLLETIAFSEQNIRPSQEDNEATSSQDVNYMPSNSLIRYLVINDCFGRLRMSLFGYFVDDEATTKAIPLCRALVCLATASDDARLRIFILDNLLPCLIQRLDNQLPCAVQKVRCKLNSNASFNGRMNKPSSSASNKTSRDLVMLCQELYGYMLRHGHAQTQALTWEGKNIDYAENSFEVWLGRQKEDFRVKAYSAAKELPMGHKWNWEFEDEFQRYLSSYIDMLREVDAFNESAEDIYVDKESIFHKLSSKFRSKYAVNSWVHPYMATISSIRQRKLCSMAAVARNNNICNFLHKLIKLQPYVKVSDCACDVIYRFKQTFEIPAELCKYVPPSVELLLSILAFWEPRFHPLIREAHMDNLLGVIDGFTRSECLKPVMPIIRDFPLHLQPYATAFVETQLKESKYYIAKEQVRLHEEFDQYLASGALDNYMNRFMSSKDDFVEELVANKLVPSQFWVLERCLIKLSFERRAEIVRVQTEICSYASCLQRLFENEALKPHVESMVGELEAEGFFNVDSNQINWGKTLFSELIEKFSSEFFSGHNLPKHYAIRGLIDCQTILLQTVNWQAAVKKVAVDACSDLAGHLPRLWEDSRYYEHHYYAITRNPLRQVIRGALD